MISLSGINRTYRVGDTPVHALREIDLQIAAGDYVAVMGPSGSGKSTLLHVLGLLDSPDSGRYTFLGRDMLALDEAELAAARREQIGFVFQAFHLVPRLSARENVELPMTLASVPAAQRAARAARALAALDLEDRAEHRPDQLSGGQRQRVAIARAIVMQPRLLLADEPTGNLDRAAGEEVVRVLEALNRDGMTVVVVTHDPQIGARAARRVTMDDGRIVADAAQR